MRRTANWRPTVSHCCASVSSAAAVSALRASQDFGSSSEKRCSLALHAATYVTFLMRHGLELTLFEEHTTVPWKGLDHMVPADIPGEFTLPDRANRVAMSYTIVAEKRVS